MTEHHTHPDPAVRALIEQAEARGRAEGEARAAALEAAVLAIHKPIRVYDECEHDPDHGCEPIEVYDYMGCSESMIGWGCSTCCYDDEYPREDCPHGADHRDVTEDNSCPTHAALSDSTALDRALDRARQEALREFGEDCGRSIEAMAAASQYGPHRRAGMRDAAARVRQRANERADALGAGEQ